MATRIFSTVTGYRPLELDLHVPEGDGPFPTVVWIHGGGWQEGGRAILPDSITPFGLFERLVARGYAVASVDYRLALEAQYPAQLTDVQAAIYWLRLHAGELSLDPARFATMGESAGGHLAAMAALTLPDEAGAASDRAGALSDGAGDLAVQAVVDWYGASELDFRDPGDAAGTVAVLLGGPIGGRRDFARWASPLHRVHAGAPPFLLMHGTEDQVVPYAQSVAMAEALRAQGVRADLYPVEGADHCFVGCPDIGALIDACADFLDSCLK